MQKGTQIKIIHRKEFNPVDFENELRDLTIEENTPWYIEDVWMEEIHTDVTKEGYEDWYYANLYITYKSEVYPLPNLILTYINKINSSDFIIEEIRDISI